MTAPRRLAERLADGSPLLGALVRMPNEGLVELAGLVGMDFVVIDTEHGPADQNDLSHHLMAAEAAGLDVLVRTGHVEEILRVLDLGATGIIAPHISTPEEAAALVSATRYPPYGTRGFASYTRAASYGLTSAKDHHEATLRGQVTIAMIEDEVGARNASAIAGTDGIDGVLVGPADLACSMGKVGATQDPEVRRALSDVAAAVAGAGAAVMTIVSSRAAAEEAFSRGSAMVVYNVQSALGDLFQEMAGAARPHKGVEPSIVFLPGMLEDASLWDGVAQRLDGDAVPVPGRIDVDASVGEMADSVLAGAPERFLLAGHSLGGIVALEVARRAPERVTGLVLVNSSAREPTPEQLEAWHDLSARVERGHFLELAQELAVANAGRHGSRTVVDAAERMAHAVGPSALLRQVAAQAAREDMRDIVQGIATPILVVSGGRDEICPVERQSEIATLGSYTRHIVIHESGHLVPLESPGELALHILDWGKETGLLPVHSGQK